MQLRHPITSAGDWSDENRSEMSGLRMSLLSVALILFLVAVLLTWQLLPSHYLWNYLAGATIWLLAISIPVVAVAALVSSILDLMRIGGTDGEAAGKGSAVAGLILSALVLILCVVFIFSFNEPESSQDGDIRSRSTRIQTEWHEESQKGLSQESRSVGANLVFALVDSGLSPLSKKTMDHELQKKKTTGKKGNTRRPEFRGHGFLGSVSPELSPNYTKRTKTFEPRIHTDEHR
jgi:uncharacterized membrane protein